MNPEKPLPAEDGNGEIPALIETLHQTGQRLEELTAGEVDVVVDRRGRTSLLRRAQDHLLLREAAIFNALPAHIALLDPRGRITTVNESWRQFGRANAILGPGCGVGVDYLELCDSARGDDAAEARQAAAGIRSVLDGKATSFALEYPCHSPATRRWFLLTVTPMAGEHAHGAIVTHLDITEHRAAEDKIKRHSQLYAALSECNKAIVNCAGEEELFAKIAQAAVQFGGMKMAWIGIVDNGTRIVRPVASCGDDSGYLSGVTISMDIASPFGRGPTATAIRADQPYWCQAILNDPLTVPWRERAVDAGIAASASLPLHRNGMVVGTLNLYSGEPYSFDKPARDLLVDMAGDISFALDNFDRDAQRKRVEEEVKLANTILRTQQETSLDAILVVDGNGKITSCNQQFIDLWRVPPQSLIARVDALVLQAVVDQVEDPQVFDARVKHLYEHQDEKSREEVRLKDGRIVDRYTAPVTGASGDYYGRVWYFRDITERQKAQDRITYLTRVYTMLSGISALIVRARDRDELFTEACRIALEAGGFRMALIVKVDRGSMKIVPVASAGKDQEIMAAIKDVLNSVEDAPKTMIARVIREKTLLVSNDTQSDPRLLLSKYYAEAGVHSLAIFPLIVEDEAAGAIAIYASEIEFFHEEETKLLTGLAGDIAFALDHIGKAEKIARLSRIQAVMSGINAAIVRAQDRQELFNETCRVAVEQGNFGSAWVGVLDSSTHEAVQVACAGRDLCPDGVQVRIDVATGLGVASRAIREKRVVFDNDIAAPSSARGERRALAIRAGFHSMIALPFVIDDVVVGHLSLYAKEPDFFNEDELQLLTELAGNLSFALQSIDKRKKLEYLSYYDELTGLANRNLLLDRVALYLRSAASGGHQLALLMIDLERFKNINDSLGRATGDALLQQVAEWLKHAAGGTNLVARLDADHFAVIMPAVKPGDNLPRLIEQSMAAIQAHPFRLNAAVFRIAVKVGVALFPDDGAEAETLFRNAEAALKTAKASGERYLLHTQTMTAAVAGKLTLENQLRQALDNDEFVLHYQPKVNLASGQVTSAEALIRWNDPRTGLVPPGRFIPVLEDTGLIFEVGRWAIKQAIADYLRWRASGLNALRVAVNVSPLQLRRHDFITEIRQAISIDPHAAAGLEIEITESLIMENIEYNIASLQAIRNLGVTIAIDDFGTGFSSLSYLAKLPVDTLKIDRSFVLDITVGPEGLALVSTIIKLAHALKLKVVAEGVETEEQSRLLLLLECDEMQGFIFSKPVPCEIFESRYLTPTPVGVYSAVANIGDHS
ncbi:MAG: EAL domain-containing protein [Burkholderiales bacterium]|nr:EAL domain-containing protein [Burkholderiales bacterium]